jgi:toxin ParE1/3/4
MPIQVLLTEDAERDLEDLFSHIAMHDSPRSAEHVLSKIISIADSLKHTPARGTQPRELHGIGNGDYRQVFFKPYRLIYRVIDERVVIFLIADGRRDLQSMLARRLLAG